MTNTKQLSNVNTEDEITHNNKHKFKINLIVQTVTPHYDIQQNQKSKSKIDLSKFLFIVLVLTSQEKHKQITN